jgi:hypothetical protein
MGVKTEQLEFFDQQAPNNGFGNTKTGQAKRVTIPRIIPSSVKAFTANLGRGRVNSIRWELPEWDLAECGRILDTEAYVRRAFRNKKNLFMKEGCQFVGAKPERVSYIKRRFQQIEEATQIPFKIWLGQIVWSLVRTNNAFLAKVRNEKSSGGRIRTSANGKQLKPVAGYFPISPETLRFKRDEYGKILKYSQEVYGKTAVEFRPEDIIHFYFDKREGFAVGTPDLVPVKDDIRALRRIEENVELLVYQHLFPLFHYTVGTQNEPAKVYADGRDEVQEVQLKVAQMPSDGCWVTPERHKIEAISASSSPVAVEKVIAHFKQRIYTGLGVSSVDMGEGDTANKSTAQTMSRNLIDDTKANQKEFAAQFEAFIIRELLLESTFSDATLLDEENEVYLQFNEIDFESRQAKENHLVDIFLKNAITHDELRTGMGKEPFQGEGWPTSRNKSVIFTKGDGDWARTNYGLIERDKMLITAVDEPQSEQAKAESKSRTTANTAKTLSSSGGNSVSNKNTPSNQHGTRSTTKVNKDNFGVHNTIPSLSVIYMQGAPLQNMYDTLSDDLGRHIRTRGVVMSELRVLIDSAFGHAKERLISLCQRAYRLGLQDAGAEVWEVRSDVADNKINDHISRYVDKLRKDVVSQLNRHTLKSRDITDANAVFVSLIMDSLRHRATMIDNSEVMRAYNYGKVSGFRIRGFERIASRRHNARDCDICDRHILKYENSDVIIFEDLPPLHPNCTCTMEREA